jgi:lipopolysaccharide/colanic/teichoic acid biosynthesis glycosyltransferase
MREWSGDVWDGAGSSGVGQPDGLTVSYQSGLPVRIFGNMVPWSPPGFGHGQLVAKRAFDIAFSVLALAFLLPLLVFVAIAVRMESAGPAFFRQKREGVGGSTFYAYKFRSMRTEVEDASGVAQTVRGDQRVTRLGAFLRKTSIDELPQLYNVLRGEMSIVGPRPHVPNMLAGNGTYRELVPYYDSRLVIRPGITGWAQANGLRGDASDPAVARARIDHDLAYIQNYSFWLDLKIVWLTVRYEFLGGSGT